VTCVTISRANAGASKLRKLTDEVRELDEGSRRELGGPQVQILPATINARLLHRFAAHSVRIPVDARPGLSSLGHIASARTFCRRSSVDSRHLHSWDLRTSLIPQQVRFGRRRCPVAWIVLSSRVAARGQKSIEVHWRRSHCQKLRGVVQRLVGLPGSCRFVNLGRSRRVRLPDFLDERRFV
jgi:hypothetical protein